MLIAPSWGGMLNGLLTLRGAWDKVRDSVVLKFMVVAITAYGMSTFEGPLLSLKFFNTLSHFSDWTIAHVHVGGLGWNGMMIFGMLYYLIPKMWGTKLYSMKLANYHFWIATFGILLYAIPLYWAGFVQGFMWQDFNPDGTLVNASFLDTVTALKPFYAMRAAGGAVYITGALMMCYNLVRTAKLGTFIANEPAEAPALVKNVVVNDGGQWHRSIERKPVRMIVVSLIVILIGGLVEIVPTLIIKSNIPTIASVQPYTPLELEGRDIYIREGCSNCHSQMVRPLRFETKRYGEYSKAGEFVYDHPFLWGSKRTGPDLAREGQGNDIAQSDYWHYNHLIRPAEVSKGSIMPAYAFLKEAELSRAYTKTKLETMVSLGVPYPDSTINNYDAMMDAQADGIAANISRDIEALGVEVSEAKFNKIKNSEMIAIIAYLQRLGSDIHKDKPVETAEK
jgi:cytochrome c oxidase cbb3-type subunit I/II